LKQLVKLTTKLLIGDLSHKSRLKFDFLLKLIILAEVFRNKTGVLSIWRQRKAAKMPCLGDGRSA